MHGLPAFRPCTYSHTLREPNTHAQTISRTHDESYLNAH
jgi:hypothetical protein